LENHINETHKYKKWKTLIKGEYDKLKSRYKFLVTGSSRLDIYRKEVDSLQGRYHYYCLHPFSLAEVLNKKNNITPFKDIEIDSHDNLSDLDIPNRFGGFPEPLLKQNMKFLLRWHNEKTERFFREDIRDTEQIRDPGSMKLLRDMLPGKVGSLLSLNAIREYLEVGSIILRNVDKKEVDFLVTVDEKPWFAVEAKLNEETPDKTLFYFKKKLNIHFVYQVLEKPKTDRLKTGIRVVSADKFLSGLV
jgi:predicted AAA+ superfamily ATPase